MKIVRVMLLLLFSSALIGWVAPESFTQAQEDPNLVAPTEALPPEEQVKHFHLPPGFEMQLIASEPDIGQPTNIAFDSQGRLWINSSLEYPYPASGTGRDRLCYMEDTNGDGVPDKIQTFANGLNIPIGVASVHGSVIAYSIPHILRLVDSDGDGQSDRRETLFQGFGFRDTHGMASSFRPWIDGWIYACHGFANDSNVEGGDQPPVKMNSGNTYRFRADGTRFEQWTWGQVNPYGLTFDSWGNLFSSDCHTKPAFMLLRGAYYNSFGKPHDGLGYGPEMIEHFHGSTGIAGIVAYEAPHFPDEFRGNLFIGNPVTGRINRDRLEWHGSSPNAVELPDLVSCDDRWFRPVDITIAPDGSLYIADFYNCIIGHYEVRLDHPRRDRHHGRIWRLVYTGSDKSAQPPRPMPNLAKQSTNALIPLLGDANITVRVLATNELVDRIGPSAAEPAREVLKSNSASPEQRAHALWVVERLVRLATGEIEALANDPSPLVRTHLLRALGTRATLGDQRAVILAGLKAGQHPNVIRAAAEVLGWHPHSANVGPLLDAWRGCEPEDSHRIHQIRIALRNNLRDLGDMQGWLAKIEGADVTERLLDLSLGIANSDAATFALKAVQSLVERHPRERDLYHHVSRNYPEDRLSEIFPVVRTKTTADQGRQIDVLRGLHQGLQERGQKIPESELAWIVELARGMIDSRQADTCRIGIEFARDLRLSGLAPQLDALASPTSEMPTCQMTALEALAVLNSELAMNRYAEVLQHEGTALDQKRIAAETLGRLKSPAGTEILIKVLRTAPFNYATFLARGLSWSDHGGDALLRLIEEGKAAPELLNDGVVAGELQARVFERKNERLALIRQNIPTPDEALQTLVTQRQAGYATAQTDINRGLAIFQKSCANCHQIGGQGAKIGPQLDGVGIRGFDRLLEDTLDPNRNVDQAFRRTNLLLNDGSVVAGIVLRQEGAVLVIADSNGKELRIPESDVEERQESTLSPMPNDVAKALPPEEFYDLMAYLLSQQTQAPAAQ
ncbi:MAG: HEAT repeat domain-containing protein [Planctomycetaceae bacterium]|nr:HEAT repeat domain-containing protein [Planctomycetaceae bacterium]